MNNTAKQIDPINNPSVIAGMRNEIYHAASSFSSSQIKDFIKHPPAYFHAKYIAKTLPRVETEAMRLGTAVHTAWMEPNLFAREIAVVPQCDRRTKKGKEIYAEFFEASAGKTIIKAEQAKEIESMCAALNTDFNTRALLKNSTIENSIFWKDQESGLDLRVRPDIWRKGQFIADLKTTQDASESGFNKAIGNLGYHISAAMYLDGVNQLGEDLDDFIFICVESKPPYLSAVYTLSEQDLELGRELYRDALNKLANALETDNWPGHNNNEIKETALPQYFFKKESLS